VYRHSIAWALLNFTIPKTHYIGLSRQRISRGPQLLVFSEEVPLSDSVVGLSLSSYKREPAPEGPPDILRESAVETEVADEQCKAIPTQTLYIIYN